MKKKLVAGLLATAMVASVFTGCGKKSDKKSENKESLEVTAEDKGEIKLWVADLKLILTMQDLQFQLSLQVKAMLLQI